MAMNLLIRKACIRDAQAIHRLINTAAKATPVLPRSLHNVYDQLRDFSVAEFAGAIIGCAALHVSWEDLAELRSLVVDAPYRTRGVGKKLVETCVQDAAQLGISRIFLLTAAPSFFEHLGFTLVDKATLPHKIWRDCLECAQFPDCCEVALLKELRA